MIGLGLRLRDWPTGGVTWRDLAAILRHLPSDSSYKRAKVPGRPKPEDQVWLLRNVEHTLRVLAWQNTKQEEPQPEPFRWACEKGSDAAPGPDAYELDEIDAVMARLRGA